MVAAMFLRDATDASTAEPAPRPGDDVATAIDRGFFEAGRFGDNKRPKDG
jgi:hypothetical protein